MVYKNLHLDKCTKLSLQDILDRLWDVSYTEKKKLQ